MASYADFNLFPVAMALLHHLDSHRTRRAAYHRGGSLDIRGVHVLHLLLRNVANLTNRHPADMAAAGGLRSLLDSRRLHQEIARRRRLGDEVEGTVRKTGNDNRNWHSLFKGLRSCVELFAELHDIQSALAKGRADRG